jgi:hypothetical protein
LTRWRVRQHLRAGPRVHDGRVHEDGLLTSQTYDGNLGGLAGADALMPISRGVPQHLVPTVNVWLVVGHEAQPPTGDNPRTVVIPG